MKLKLLVPSLLLASCSKPYYIPTNNDSFATVSFSNLSPENPVINIIDNCNSSTINNSFIEHKKPSDRSKYNLKIPVKRKITFEYNYLWVSGQSTQIVTSETDFTSKIDLLRSNDISTCKETVTFIAEENKHYEVYFGKNIENCVIKASESQGFGSKNKQLLSIKLLKHDRC